MDFSKQEVEYISLALQKGPVTFNGVSTDLTIHITKAKLLLYNYYQTNQDQVSASFIATGTRQGNHLVKLLHGEDEAKDADHYFDQLDCVHIYSLALATNSFTDSEIAMYELNHSIDPAKLGEQYLLGTIRGPDLTAIVQHVKPQPAPSVPSAPVQKRETPQQTAKPKATEPGPKKKLEYTSRKEKPQPLLLSGYVSRKGEKRPQESEKPKPVSKPTYQYKSRKVEQSQPKERVVVSQMEPDNDMDMEPEPPVGANVPKTDINKLFLDDLSDFDDDSMDVDQPDQPIIVEPIVVDDIDEPEMAVDSPKVSAPQIPQDSVFRSLASKPSATEPEFTPEPEKTETTIDEDGYITTYRAKPASKPAAKPAAQEGEKPTPATKKRMDTEKKKNDGKKKQTSLMSFFGKR